MLEEYLLFINNKDGRFRNLFNEKGNWTKRESRLPRETYRETEWDNSELDTKVSKEKEEGWWDAFLIRFIFKLNKWKKKTKL